MDIATILLKDNAALACISLVSQLINLTKQHDCNMVNLSAFHSMLEHALH